MSEKRKLTAKELRVVILDKDVKVDGHLKKTYQVHIGRVNHRKGNTVAIACKTDEKIRWEYYFNPFSMLLVRICPKCFDVMRERFGGNASWIFSEMGKTPASNTGVN